MLPSISRESYSRPIHFQPKTLHCGHVVDLTDFPPDIINGHCFWIPATLDIFPKCCLRRGHDSSIKLYFVKNVATVGRFLVSGPNELGCRYYVQDEYCKFSVILCP